MLQANNTKLSKEHQSSSVRGRSRSATTSLAHANYNDSSKKKEIMRRKRGSSLPQHNDDLCSLRLTICCSTISKRWFIKKPTSETQLHHCNHLPVSANDIIHNKASISTEVKKEIFDLIESGASNNVIVNIVQTKFNVRMSSALVRSFRTERIDQITQNVAFDATSQSSIDRLLNLFQSLENISYVYVKHNNRTGFVTYHKAEKQMTELDNEVEKDIAAWRKALSIDGTSDILVSIAWCHDAEKRQLVMFPEFISVDMTFGLNKERRNLLTFVGIDGHNRSFTGCRCWMPSKQTVAYRWAIDVALPILLGKNSKCYDIEL